MTTSRTPGASPAPGNGSGRDGGRAAGRTGGAGPRTLAEELRHRADESLAALLRSRPDLLSPVPGDLTQLATRAGTRASVVRAVERLDRFALQTAEALAVAPDPCPYPTLLALLTGDDPEVRPGDGPAGRPGDGGTPAERSGDGTGRPGDAGIPAERSGAGDTATGASTPAGTSAGPAVPAAAAPTGTSTGAATGVPGDAAAGTTPRAAIAAELPRVLGTLRAQALVWGADDRLRLVRTARELLAPSGSAPSPTGLGPTVAEATAGMSPGRLQEILAAAGLPATHDPVTAVAALTTLFEDRARMAALLAQAPPEASAVLARLTWGPPFGEVSVAAPGPPVRWLLDRGLLLPSGPRHVVLPREVGLHLRGGRTHRDPEPLPPAPEPAAEHRPQTVDAAAAGQAHTALATVEELLGLWDTGGPPVLRAGGLSVRDLRRTAAALDVTEPVAAFWIELAHAAGLLASDGDADERFAPTPAYDDWLRLPAAERWAELAAAWLAATRTPGLVGTRDAKGRTLAALGPDLDRSPAPEVRRRVLELLAAPPAGTALTEESLLARLRWERPLRTAGGAAGGTAARAGVRPGAGGAGTGPAANGATRPPAAAPVPATGPAGGASAGAFVGTAPEAPSPGRTRAAGGPAGPPARLEDLRSRLARWTLAEAELLGVTGRGALAAHGRALLGAAHGSGAATPGDGTGAATTGPGPGTTGARPAGGAGGGTASAGRPAGPDRTAAAMTEAARLLAPLLPEPLDHVLLQADLTAVAPGPLERPLAAALGVLAEVESKGGATVYRFTPASVRRALDAGRSAADLHAFLAAHSRTPVPQPLSYLIDDVARKHGLLRVGAASAYVRCDDDALLAEILADRRAANLRLRRLAPTVLAAQVPPEALLDGLRGMGYAPAAESAEGDVVVSRPDAHRTPPRAAPVPVPDGPPVPDETLLGAAIRAIRAGDRAATTPHKAVPAPTGRAGTAPAAGGLPRTSTAETLATMQAAVLTGTPVWIGYVNAEGGASQRVIAPVRVEGGFVTAYDHTADEVRTYPLHRVTGAAELTDEES
ncbi:helicase C-terminal domain-containing protein [Streptomyces pactum]|uniref:helicase C-terminal domain-containing protein n=1 Tax=Streptomyces pactum TaxID=68249 RepID=UPI001E42B50B|nr:helicase C-terminal domain-containing protein [Streptomyces pactum]